MLDRLRVFLDEAVLGEIATQVAEYDLDDLIMATFTKA